MERLLRRSFLLSGMSRSADIASTLDGLGQREEAEHGLWRLSLDSGGRILASGSGDGTVRVWDVAGTASPRVLDNGGEWVRAVTIDPPGRYVACVPAGEPFAYGTCRAVGW
jgi:WD40 repeat protein